MPIFAQNFSWMAFNTLLAFVPVVLTVVLRQKLSRPIHLILFFIWLIFLPNTIYLITDLQHLPAQLIKSPMGEQAILLIQYVVLTAFGVITYVYSLEPVSLILKKMRLKEINRDALYVLLNFLVAFGVMLGKVQRTHSWYVFTQPLRVASDVSEALSSQSQIVWVIFIGIIINILFFLFRDYFSPLQIARKGKR